MKNTGLVCIAFFFSLACGTANSETLKKHAEGTIQFQLLSEFESPILGAFSGIIGGVLVVAGGIENPDEASSLNELIISNTAYYLRPGAAAWEQATLSEGVAFGASVVVGDELRCYGGVDANGVRKTSFRLLFKDGELVQESIVELPEPLAFASAASYQGDIILTGGVHSYTPLKINRQLIWLRGQEVYQIDAPDLGLSPASRDAITGGDAATNAAILRCVLEGKPGPHRDVVVLNAAAGILAGQDGGEWREAIQAAQKSIDSGAALEKLEQLSRISYDS